MKTLRNLIKRLITATLYRSGIAWAWYAWAFRRQALVLMYHRVLPVNPAPDAFSADAIVVTPETFARQMRFLRRFFNPVDADTFRDMLQGKKPWKPRTCLVTFDDGWYDNLAHALPVLEQEKVPAIVFIATGYVGTQTTFWQERLTRLLFMAWQRGAPVNDVFGELGAAWIAKLPEAEARPEVRHLVTRLKVLPRAEIDALDARLVQRLRDAGVEFPGIGDDRFMSWQETERLAKSGVVSLGSHAHSHSPLTSITADEAGVELARASQEMHEHLGLAPRFFAYPNGNYDDAVVERVRKAQFELAFTTDAGWVARGDDPLRLRRINIGERGTESSAGFMCRLLRWI